MGSSWLTLSCRLNSSLWVVVHETPWPGSSSANYIFIFLHGLLGGGRAPFPGMQEVGRLGTGRGARLRSGTGTGASANTDGRGKAGKKKKKKNKKKKKDWSTEQRISVRRKNIWEFQRILDGNKGSLHKTHNGQTESNDKVWSLNLETEKTLEVLAGFTSASRSQTVTSATSTRSKRRISWRRRWRLKSWRILQCQRSILEARTEGWRRCSTRRRSN